MDFHKIEFQDLDDLNEDELRELATEFAEAQKTNIEQFEEVTDRVDDFEQFDSELSEELVETSPLSEGEVDAISFSRKRELLSEFSADEPEGDDPEGEEADDGPEEFGQQGETHGDDEDETPQFVKDAFDSAAGVQL